MSPLSDKVAFVKPKPLRAWKRTPEALLHPQIPLPLHGLAPRLLLGSGWWNRVRTEAYESTNYRCVACAAKKKGSGRYRLEAHETYSIDYLLGRSYYGGTIPLCNYCHSYIHRGRLEFLKDVGKISEQRYIAVLLHGDSILRAEGLERPRPYDGPTAEWGDWRLVVEGKEYPPRFKSIKELDEYHVGLNK